MNIEKSSAFTYGGVTVHSSSLAFVIASSDKLIDEQPNHSFVFRWKEGAWGQIPLAERAIDACIITAKIPILIIVCANGDVQLMSSAGSSSEDVDSSQEGPNDLMTLRASRAIEGVVHVAGMARRVYRRSHSGSWQAIDQGVFTPAGSRTQTAGFLCIDGFNLNEIYTAGYKGEIWSFDGSKWEQQASPTDVALTCMRCSESGDVYIAGLAGLIIRGRHNRWEVVEQTITEDDFWGLTIFKGIPYFASNRALYAIKENSLEKISLNTTERVTTRFLDCNDDVIWSVGDRHIFSSSDGTTWENLSGPE